MREGHNLTIHLVHEANQNWVSCSFSRSHFMFYVTRNTWSRMERERERERERKRNWEEERERERESAGSLSAFSAHWFYWLIGQSIFSHSKCNRSLVQSWSVAIILRVSSSFILTKNLSLASASRIKGIQYFRWPVSGQTVNARLSFSLLVLHSEMRIKWIEKRVRVRKRRRRRRERKKNRPFPKRMEWLSEVKFIRGTCGWKGVKNVSWMVGWEGSSDQLKSTKERIRAGHRSNWITER